MAEATVFAAGRADEVLCELLRDRRLLPDAGGCAARPCCECLRPHLARVEQAMAAGEPLELLLPAFPAKSPSPRKVLGVLPDLAEELALRHLQSLCDKIETIHPPGARILLCSDGRVFSDLVGVQDFDVTRYCAQLRKLVARLRLPSLRLLTLDDLLSAASAAGLRAELCARWAEPLAQVRERHRTPGGAALFCGIQRFLYEDALGCIQARGEPVRRGPLREACGERADEVIRRSAAFGRLLAERFPGMLRLSIHPQPAHSPKIGVRLGPARGRWLTPWHGVALRRQSGFELVPRHQAESLGARLIHREGRPSHFELP